MQTNQRRSLSFVEVATDGILDGGAELVESLGLGVDRVAERLRLVAVPSGDSETLKTISTSAIALPA